ncbi:MAG: cardiolipin synthase [Roseburia sp.]|nr:cardiolipin synthase [Roseburia sp.]
MSTEGMQVGNSIKRLVVVVMALLLQISWVLLIFLRFNEYSTICHIAFQLVALLLVLRIYARYGNTAVKMLWIILILTVPILGICLYFLIGYNYASQRMRKQSVHMSQKLSEWMEPDGAILSRLEQEDFGIANQCRYIQNYGKYPLCQNTDVVFYPIAEEGLEAQLEELSKAEHFIFMEYFAVQDRSAFARIREVLAERAAKGVEVRLLYDDIGSVVFINKKFIEKMKSAGIQCKVFNEVVPVLNIFMNNRDHRKLTIIDGKVGFTGGYNLADEYFNITHPYGHWKDTGVKLTGDGVRNLTAMFLEMWNIEKESDTDFSRYFKASPYEAQEKGYVLPYGDSPLDNEYVGENVYLNIIKEAKHKLYLATPYLVLSDEMIRELYLAAQRGVDVRIITPGIPDKKMVYKLTRSYYAPLVQRGVRIYEYTPGFIHQKQVLCDDRTAIVGTINFDYRSLYHHFENGVFLYGYKAIQRIAEDFENLLTVSSEVTEHYGRDRSKPLRISQCILRLIAPLL